MRRVLTLAAVAMLLAWPAVAQNQSQVFFDSGSTPKVIAVSPTNPLPVTGGSGGAVVVTPSGVTSTNVSSTIAITDTFQSLQVATSTRKGCTVQNNGSAAMYVFFGAIGSATKAASLVLSPGDVANCTVGSIVLTDQISITGTATQTFMAAVQ